MYVNNLHVLLPNYSLRDGRTIHTVSALLLQLVQTSAHDVRLKVKRLAINRQQSFVMRHDSQMDGSTEAFLADRDHEVCLSHTDLIGHELKLPCFIGDSIVCSRARLRFQGSQNHRSISYSAVSFEQWVELTCRLHTYTGPEKARPPRAQTKPSTAPFSTTSFQTF